jgi:hypothetical protein
MVTMCGLYNANNPLISCYYPLASNQIVTINSFLGNLNNTYFRVFYGGYSSSNYFQQIIGSTSSYAAITKGSEITFTGASYIGLFGTGAFPSVLTFTLHTPAPNTNTISYVPENSVVIPTSATGNVQIILESSSDLVNWIPSLPGAYGSTYTNRFFRVRAVAQ